MIKVLLLDDEKLALEYLENIISWEMYGFEIVGTLMDARQALKVFRKTRPELVISDVCMYGMDGLDFVAAIREIDQNAHILFLSGYKNFDYVQEAIRLGIDDYLLKSDIDEEIFLSKILRIKSKIEKERQKIRYTEGTIFKELFTKNIQEKEYKEILGETEYIRLHKKYYYLIISQKKPPAFLEKYFPGIFSDSYLDEPALRIAIQRQAELMDIRNAAAFALNETEMLAVFELKGNLVSQKEIYESLYRLAHGIYDGVNRKDDVKYNILFYPKGCAVRQFGQMYRENRKQLGQCYIKQDTQILEFEISRQFFPETKVESAVSGEQIYQSIWNRDQQKTEEYMEALMISVEQEDYITYLWYVKEIMAALAAVEKSMEQAEMRRGFSVAESVKKYDLCNPYEVIKFIRYKLEEIGKLFNEMQDSPYSKSIREALDFIQENYAQEDLSTNFVAKQVNLSTSWLSTKFKEEVGVGISDYLNDVRIQHAKMLLDQEDYMIYEVAEKVGFASSQYFSKIFKQITGLTPNEYKRMK